MILLMFVLHWDLCAQDTTKVPYSRLTILLDSILVKDQEMRLGSDSVEAIYGNEHPRMQA